jgi:DNA repair protein RecO (recombination protein O)
MPLCRDSLAALRHIVYEDPKRLYSFQLGGDPLRRLSDAAEAFSAAQLERGFKTLDFYKSLQPLEITSR